MKLHTQKLFTALVLLVVLAFINTLFAQGSLSDQELYFRKESGLDELLFQGKAYEYEYSRAIGHPFYGNNEFVIGELLFQGIKYIEQPLKFDIYEQVLVLHLDMKNFKRDIRVNPDKLEEFTMYGKTFRKFHQEGLPASYYEVVAEAGELAFLRQVYKTREISHHLEGFQSYEFKEMKSRSYLLFEGRAERFKNRKSLLAIFPDELKQAVSDYLRSNKLKLKKVSDEQLQALLEFCQQELTDSTGP